MKGTILEKIVETKRQRVDAAKRAVDPLLLKERAAAAAAHRDASPHPLREALADRSRINIIAEYKKASPSKGTINEILSPIAVAAAYESGGAAAISVLTEEDNFGGSLDDLIAARSIVRIPILRKDFIFDPFQVYEAAAAGADAILLIAAMLDNSQLSDLEALAEDELGMDALIEVHTLEELERIKDGRTKLIGVNNRDLHSFKVSLDVSRQLIHHAPAGSIMVAESGISDPKDILELRTLGFSGFLIGETLMRSSDPGSELRRLRDKS